MSTEGLDFSEDDREALCGLPFVTDGPAGLFFWEVVPTGIDELDFANGEAWGLMALELAKQTGSVMVLACAMRDMVIAGQFTATEAGFLARVACAAKAGSMN
jgi:hypothetical protein